MALGGVLLALAPGFEIAVAGRLVSGVGGALLTIAGAKMVLDRFSGAAVALAMGLMLMAWPFGIGLALLVLPLLGENWRSALWLSAGFCAVAFFLTPRARRWSVGSQPSPHVAAPPRMASTDSARYRLGRLQCLLRRGGRLPRRPYWWRMA